MLERFRRLYADLMTPAARIAVALRMTPDLVTWLGTVLVVVVALVMVPQGWLWQGALVMGQVTSYAKARGLALGFKVWGGLAARGDRLLALLLGMLLTGLGLAWALPVALAYLLCASSFTVLQRMGQVKRQAAEAQDAGVTMVDPQATVAAEHQKKP